VAEVKQTQDRIDLIGESYRLEFEVTGDETTGLKFFHVDERGEYLMAAVRYFGVVYETHEEEPLPMTAMRPVVEKLDDRETVSLTCIRDDRAQAILQFVPLDGQQIDINAHATVLRPGANRMGMRVLCMDCLNESERVRILFGVYSGWNEGRRGFFAYPRFLPGVPKQFTVVKHYTRTEPGVIHAKEQGIALTYPEASFGASRELSCGTEIIGGWHLEFTSDDCWDPDLDAKAITYAPPDSGIQPPRHSFETHLANWRTLMKRPELWVDFGNGTGFYHRGFYGVCGGKMDVSGVLAYDGPKCLGTLTDRLCELSWGGSSNVLIAYTMFQLGEEWALEKARAILKGVVEFRPGGYQAQEGALKGAWYNGWLVDEGRFADRYGRDSVYTPDQGITNYFLGKCLIEGLSSEDRIVSMMEKNCEYLQSLEMPGGGIRFGIRPDGSTAVDRHEIVYDIYGGDMALAAGAAAISHLMTFRLTGKETYRDKAKQYLDHQLRHIAENNWRFHGYDTYGTNSQGLSWHLIILSEFLRDGFAEAEAAAERTLRHLISFQHRFDMGLDRHSDLERPWGGEMRGRGTFPTGSTRHFAQDYLNGHNRFDPSEALWAYYTATNDARAYASLLNFVNYLTYHQFVRTGLPIGLGAVTEQMHFEEGHLQDTVQTLHSNPLQHVLLSKGLFLQACGSDVKDVGLSGDKVRFTLVAPEPRRSWFMMGGKGSRKVAVYQGEKLIHFGMGRFVPCEVTGGSSFDVRSAR